MSRYFGPARIRIHGDQTAGSKYIGLARTLLGEQMGIHIDAYDSSRGLASQSKMSKEYAAKPIEQIERSVGLPDGTRIAVAYNTYMPVIDIWVEGGGERKLVPECHSGLFVQNSYQGHLDELLQITNAMHPAIEDGNKDYIYSTDLTQRLTTGTAKEFVDGLFVGRVPTYPWRGPVNFNRENPAEWQQISTIWNGSASVPSSVAEGNLEQWARFKARDDINCFVQQDPIDSTFVWGGGTDGCGNTKDTKRFWVGATPDGRKVFFHHNLIDVNRYSAWRPDELAGNEVNGFNFGGLPNQWADGFWSPILEVRVTSSSSYRWTDEAGENVIAALQVPLPPIETGTNSRESPSYFLSDIHPTGLKLLLGGTYNSTVRSAPGRSFRDVVNITELEFLVEEDDITNQVTDVTFVAPVTLKTRTPTPQPGGYNVIPNNATWPYMGWEYYPASQSSYGATKEGEYEFWQTLYMVENPATEGPWCPPSGVDPGPLRTRIYDASFFEAHTTTPDPPSYPGRYDSLAYPSLKILTVPKAGEWLNLSEGQILYILGAYYGKTEPLAEDVSVQYVRMYVTYQRDLEITQDGGTGFTGSGIVETECECMTGYDPDAVPEWKCPDKPKNHPDDLYAPSGWTSRVIQNGPLTFTSPSFVGVVTITLTETLYMGDVAAFSRDIVETATATYGPYTVQYKIRPNDADNEWDGCINHLFHKQHNYAERTVSTDLEFVDAVGADNEPTRIRQDDPSLPAYTGYSNPIETATIAVDILLFEDTDVVGSYINPPYYAPFGVCDQRNTNTYHSYFTASQSSSIYDWDATRADSEDSYGEFWFRDVRPPQIGVLQRVGNESYIDFHGGAKHVSLWTAEMNEYGGPDTIDTYDQLGQVCYRSKVAIWDDTLATVVHYGDTALYRAGPGPYQSDPNQWTEIDYFFQFPPMYGYNDCASFNPVTKQLAYGFNSPVCWQGDFSNFVPCDEDVPEGETPQCVGLTASVYIPAPEDFGYNPGFVGTPVPGKAEETPDE